MLPTEFKFLFRIQQFQRKSDAFCVAIVFDTNNLPAKYEYEGVGYQFPAETKAATPTGLDTYPAIFTFPEVFKHSIVLLLTERFPSVILVYVAWVSFYIDHLVYMLVMHKRFCCEVSSGEALANGDQHDGQPCEGTRFLRENSLLL